jgi:transposase
MTKVELFEAIRRDGYVQDKSVRAIARERGVHRRVVRQALNSALPRPRKALERAAPVLTPALQTQVEMWLRADDAAPRKQRHTARRVWQRLQAEYGFGGAESTVRRLVAQMRRQLGLKVEAFVPQSHAPGDEAEVDWYEATVRFPWGEEVVQFFEMRACFSGREFHMAFPRQTQQAFLEGHVEAFCHFGGVFARIRYDNLKAAVVKVLRGRRRVESDRFVALRSHYLYSAEFCRPGVQGAHEKGGVEGGVGRFRRRHLVPVPTADSYEALNRLLLDACAQDDLRQRQGHQTRVVDDFAEEACKLRASPSEPFDTAEVSRVRVSAKGCVQLRRAFYSVPVRLVGRQVEARVHAAHIEIVADGEVVARHARLVDVGAWRAQLDHYLELLRQKPQALRQSLPLRQARQRSEWPEAYDRLWEALRARHGDSEGTRQVIDVLMLHREHPNEEVEMAVSLALQYGSIDAPAVELLVRQLQTPQRTQEPLTDLGELARYNRPLLPVSDYDQLLGRVWPSMEVH